MEFCELQLSHKERIESLRRDACHETSSHAFVSLYLWRHAMGLSVAFFENAFLIKCREGYFFPCGEERDVLALVNAVWEEEPSAVFYYAREEDAALMSRVFGDKIVKEYDSAAREYLYQKDEQIAMQGKRFTYQRAKVNKAKRLGEIRSELLTDSLLDSARKITKAWAARREDDGDAKETLEALDRFSELSLFGNLFYVNGEAVGFNLGSYLSERSFDIHIAKTLVDDVDTAMKLELYRALPERVEIINREEDLGIRGLAIHKQDAQPFAFHEMYRIRLAK